MSVGEVEFLSVVWVLLDRKFVLSSFTRLNFNTLGFFRLVDSTNEVPVYEIIEAVRRY
jgi:hypothetical protein